ncbi:HEAT repeat domain-containing protein [Niastella caeni]|uniref:HEAT repeat domain-containing protein n=1 Tax=Niastella caeni TaxID=2569763 RepID=A0A4S8HVU0_9BACT|nr:HEAT repeat domain-containing protein [Niastella caeni]THU39757.1 HEAT repeat domain-containing protein [Niastella caeni]THU39760.1 HEAT repeat domain-containing protein [Niastella caeni]
MTRPDTLYGLDIPYDKPVDELVQLTKEPPPVCWNAYTALALNSSDKAINALSGLLTNQDWTHLRSAIEAIGKNEKGIQLEDKLLAYLDNPHQFVVTAAINALSNLKSAKAHNKIKLLTKAENIEVCKTAITALSNIWSVSDFDFLLQLDKLTRDESVRKSIGFVLAEHVDKNNWNDFFTHYNSDSIARHREWSLCFAGEFANDEKLIEPFLNDKDGHIRKRAQAFIKTTKSA